MPAAAVVSAKKVPAVVVNTSAPAVALVSFLYTSYEVAPAAAVHDTSTCEQEMPSLADTPDGAAGDDPRLPRSLNPNAPVPHPFTARTQ